MGSTCDVELTPHRCRSDNELLPLVAVGRVSSSRGLIRRATDRSLAM